MATEKQPVAIMQKLVSFGIPFESTRGAEIFRDVILAGAVGKSSIVFCEIEDDTLVVILHAADASFIRNILEDEGVRIDEVD